MKYVILTCIFLFIFPNLPFLNAQEDNSVECPCKQLGDPSGGDPCGADMPDGEHDGICCLDGEQVECCNEEPVPPDYKCCGDTVIYTEEKDDTLCCEEAKETYKSDTHDCCKQEGKVFILELL